MQDYKVYLKIHSGVIAPAYYSTGWFQLSFCPMSVVSVPVLITVAGVAY